MNDNLSREEMMTQLEDLFQRTGKAYGRMIFGRAVMLQLPPDEVEAGIDAAVEDSRDYFKEGGICDHDTDIACNLIKLAIVQEGQRIIMALPDDLGGIQ
ncbi:hypothetical protein [Agrobacterium tumefaciens]|uniref:hypothetical protein n=1 Tax=Agrobacterium tumefaciens TaxID=358 RepID=UPI001571A81A|nr:hypothetical protein [Agrobacterium tumefaciens]NSX91473.1 hypothetical protein [Agrobacterium tumefaciens]